MAVTQNLGWSRSNKQYAALQHYKKQYKNRKARKPSGLRAFFLWFF